MFDDTRYILYGIFLFISLVHAHVWGLLTNFVYVCVGCSTVCERQTDRQTVTGYDGEEDWVSVLAHLCFVLDKSY